jgi:hypothetical protein
MIAERPLFINHVQLGTYLESDTQLHYRHLENLDVVV